MIDPIWKLYPTLSAPMPLQMALDEILFRRLESAESAQDRQPAFRFFYSSEPWITTGYSREGANHSLMKIPVCRRITGGGHVLHGKDLIFSLMAKKDADESFKSVRISYFKIHEAVKSAFEHLGQNLRFYRCDEKLPKGRDCFLYPIATDLALGDQKIAGGSQKRSGATLLHQESVQVPKKIDPADLLKALRQAFEKKFQIRFESAPLDPALLMEAEHLAEGKYAPKIEIPEPLFAG